MLEDLISWVREYETGRFMTISKELSGNTAKPPSVRNPRLSVRCEYADTSLPGIVNLSRRQRDFADENECEELPRLPVSS